ncbi:DUF1330 domain-containing protein [Granulicella sp. 5B5]|uniref:DUF1330 domain-containing protein n=1 Tax=Granulicella sp. 5B5 TaxID=1617967 RepID=UPI0015F4A68B|nr:DUF1330 domain-containing protein [Granulicella sp. 5B5]QMV17431.1 DUF1330 domain-containing protein [Granulicella sp. 5B5]
MSAIMISDITVLNEEAFQTYRTRAAPVIEQFGGRYLARNGEVRVLEGQWKPRAIVVVEFPSLEQAETWYRSPEYAHALEVRDLALTRDLILVDGYGGE